MYFVILVTLFVFSIMNEYFCNQKNRNNNDYIAENY